MKNNENEVEIFDKETMQKLIDEGYTQKEINEAKAQTERLMRRLDMEEYKQLTEHSNPEGTMTFKEAYEAIDFSKKHISEEIRDIKRMFINTKEADVMASLIHLNNYRLEGAKNDDFFVNISLNHLKSVLSNYMQFNSFDISEDCADKMKEAIKFWNAPKNDSKKKVVRIRPTMPDKTRIKYNLDEGNYFQSQKDLAEYCGVSMGMITKWKKCNYIEEV